MNALGRAWLWGGCFGLMACGQAGSPTVETRDASSSECSTGGTVLLVNGDVQATVCNGQQGEPGEVGAPGEVGPAGNSEADVSSGGIVDTLFCTLSDETTFLSVYVWQIEGSSAGLDNVAICRLGEANFADTVPMIGIRCSLLSPSKGVIEIQINVAAGTAVASGDMTGQLECS